MQAGSWMLRSAAAITAVVLLTTAGAAAQQLSEAEIAAFHARALELLSDRNYDSKASDHYIVRTDDPRVDVVKVSAFLEGLWKHFDTQLSALGEIQDQPGKVEVLLFYSRYKYDRLHEDMRGIGTAGAAGHYRSDLDVIAVHTDAVGPGDLPGLLSHEAAHHLITHRVYGPESKGFSRWVNEGLGSYFGYTRMDAKGIFHAGEIGGQAVSLLRRQPVERARIPRERLEGFRKLMREAPPGYIDDLVREEMQRLFYVEEALERYTAAWLLVHFLLHGEGGSLGGPFREYIAMEAAGKGGAEPLYRTLGVSAPELEAAFAVWVKKLRAR